ncbi:MAG: hypothetical protein FWE63_01885 [Bacteroidales bacterium]|nr:hypothetical protein [Bacteroidales bacterium]
MSECKCRVFDKGIDDFQHEIIKIVPFKDKGSSTEYRYENQSSNPLAKYRVDGGLISDDGAKCDYLLLNCKQRQSYFIELKGSDLIRAIEQIDRSIDKLKNQLLDFSFFARIVLSRANTINLRDTKLLRLKKKVESLKGNLKMQSRFLEERI